MHFEVSLDDAVRSQEIANEIGEKTAEAITHFEKLITRVDDGGMSTSKGISFLEVKYQLLLEYLTNLTLVMCHKCAGHSLDGDTGITRLVEIRTVLEKMRPIEQKLKYQIDKLVRTAVTGMAGEADPLRFKPNPGNLISKLDEEEDEDEEGGSEEEKGRNAEKSKVYRPPKLAPMHYDGDDADRQQQKTERAKRRALGSSLMRELRSEHDDAPHEIHDGADLHRQRANRDEKEKAAYEEKYFVRMSVTKKEMNASRKVRTITGLDDLTQFSDIRALTGHSSAAAEEDGMQRRNKRKSGSGKKSGKGSKKRKFH